MKTNIRPFTIGPDPDGVYDVKITQQLNSHQGWVMTLTMDEAKELRRQLRLYIAAND